MIPGYNGGRIDRRQIIKERQEALTGQTTVYDMTFNDTVLKVWDWFDEHNLHDPVMQMVKVQEEVGELAHEISRGHYDTPEVVDALGDSLVTLIGMCHHLNIEPGFALHTAYNEIKNRKGKVINNSFVKEEDEERN